MLWPAAAIPVLPVVRLDANKERPCLKVKPQENQLSKSCALTLLSVLRYAPEFNTHDTHLKTTTTTLLDFIYEDLIKQKFI